MLLFQNAYRRTFYRKPPATRKRLKRMGKKSSACKSELEKSGGFGEVPGVLSGFGGLD